MVHPYSRIDTITTSKKLHFISSNKFDFHKIDNQSIAVHAFASRILMLFSVDETLLPRLVNLTITFTELPFTVMSPFLMKRHIFNHI